MMQNSKVFSMLCRKTLYPLSPLTLSVTSVSCSNNNCYFFTYFNWDLYEKLFLQKRKVLNLKTLETCFILLTFLPTKITFITLKMKRCLFYIFLINDHVSFRITFIELPRIIKYTFSNLHICKITRHVCVLITNQQLI